VIEFKTLAKAASFFSNLLRAGRITILNSDLQSASARNPQHVRRNEDGDTGFQLKRPSRAKFFVFIKSKMDGFWRSKPERPGHETRRQILIH
jgi:hypothetical protein